MKSPGARWATWAIVALHAGLLVWMLPDYFADNDLGYHISLARQYAEHGTYSWDNLNYAPGGRPNLQGPLLHYAVGLLGRALGGSGDNYVLAFAILAVVQWAVAVFTVVFFARRFGGDLAGLSAAALLAGGVFSAASFYVGVPSGWIFLLTVWAIYFFLQDRIVLSALFTGAVIYVHLGGITTAPLGLFVAAALTRRWRLLARVGAITAVLAAPYIFHFLRSLDYYVGRRGHVAGSVNYLLYLLAVPGLILILRKPREHALLVAWIVAPLAWFFQDRLRFFLQSSAAGAVVGGLFTAWLLARVTRPRLRTALATVLVAIATIFPLSIPSLAVEMAWATGRGFPRELDWKEARILADILRDDHLENRILSSYYASLGCAAAVYTPISQQGGHWGEVRPRIDPARKISAGEKVYFFPLSPGDDILVQLRIYGLVRIHGGTPQTSVVSLTRPGRLDMVAPMTAEILRTEALWLADHAENNKMPPFRVLFSKDVMEDWRVRMMWQRIHAGRMQLLVTVYAFALEPQHPDVAERVRGSAREFGSLANFLGDETALDYIDDARFARLRQNLRSFADEVRVLRRQSLPSAQLDQNTARLFGEYF